MAARKTKAEKAAEKEIHDAYRVVGNCVQIDIWDIKKVFDVGHKAIAAGLHGAELEAAMGAFIQTIRKN